jgi:hypothetical protein
VALIPHRIRSSIRNRVDEFAAHRVIEDFREHCIGSPQRRALLSYLVVPLLPPPRFRDRVRFSNRGIAQEIPRALNELGFAVDIVDWRNASYVPRMTYDLFVGHAGINFEKIARRLSPAVPVIYFASGVEWRECNVRQLRRLLDVAIRRGYVFGSRTVQDSEESVKTIANAVVCLGAQAAETYAAYPRVLPVNNAAFPLAWTGWERKDYRAGRSRFLFFAGGGNVLKGLDLLLEAFAGSALELYICQRIEPEFERAYHHELTECNNIHLEGFLKMRSPRFVELASTCDWVIMPTCADAQPGSVIECMAHGLLPILPDSANIDLPSGGIRIARLDVEAVGAAISLASQTDAGDIETNAKALVREVSNNYSPENFREGFKRAVSRVLAEGCQARESSTVT